MNLLILDPGNLTGWACFTDEKLVAAGTVKKADAFVGGCGGDRASVRYAWAYQHWRPDLVLIEVPRWYPHDHSDVNDLLDLSVYVGELKRFYEAMGCVVERVWPRTWKGNVPKEITNRRTLAALSPGELELLPRRPRAKDHDHNMLDAVGLGLWKLGRLR